MKNERYGLNIRITKKEIEKINTLRQKHYINISGFIRKSINDLWNKMEMKK